MPAMWLLGGSKRRKERECEKDRASVKKSTADRSRMIDAAKYQAESGRSPRKEQAIPDRFIMLLLPFLLVDSEGGVRQCKQASGCR